MVVSYKGKKTTFDVAWCSTLTYDEFETMCLGCSTFKLMPIKERINEIKKVYGNITAISTRTEKDKHSGDVRRDNKGIGAGDSRTEQSPVDEGNKHKKSKDKAEIQEQPIRKEKGKEKP